MRRRRTFRRFHFEAVGWVNVIQLGGEEQSVGFLGLRPGNWALTSLGATAVSDENRINPNITHEASDFRYPRLRYGDGSLPKRHCHGSALKFRGKPFAGSLLPYNAIQQVLSLLK